MGFAPTTLPFGTRLRARMKVSMQARMGVVDSSGSQSGLCIDRVSLRGALAGVSMDVAPGHFMSVLGGAGAGKSALMAVLSGAAVASAGLLSRDGADLRKLASHRRGFGVVAQHDALFPTMTLAQNVAYPLVLRRVPRRDRARMVEATLESVLLENAGRLPHMASAAERQRAWIARASVFGPSVLLLDEPLAHQPAEQRPLLVAALRRLHLLLGTITIMATRVAGDAMAVADQMAVLHRGTIAQAGGPASLYEQPASAVVALATGEANVLPGVVRSIDEDGICRVGLACGPTVEGVAGVTLREREACLICVRPERIAVAPTAASEMGEDALDAVVLEALHLGEGVRLRLLLGAGQEILVKRPAAAGLRGLKPGEPVAIAWQPQHASVFASA
jgi:putative spermidine/putrescine transport system ATP-binding protein